MAASVAVLGGVLKKYGKRHYPLHYIFFICLFCRNAYMLFIAGKSMERLVAACCAFVITVALALVVMRVMENLGKTGIDRHKASKPIVPEMGGLALFPGICAGYAVLHIQEGYDSLLPVALAMLIVWAIGILDDAVALRQKVKLVLMFAAGLPLLFFGIGSIDLIVFSIDGGILYYVVVLVGIAASANLTNILEGFNGEAVGLGVISLFFLSVDGLIVGNLELSSLSIIVCFALAGLLVFNRYPARTFPGDTGTLLIGGAVGAISISQGVEILGVMVLFPQIAEFLMKSRVSFKGVSYGPTQVDEKGILHPPPYDSVANCITRRIRLREPQLVCVIWAIGAACGLASAIVAYALF